MRNASLVLLLTLVLPACPEPQIPPIQQEVSDEHGVKLNLPAVPEFSVPDPEGDVHKVTEMRLKGDKYIDQEVKITGHIIWKYDCQAALRKPEMSDADIATYVKEHPEKCERPNFKLGETADAKTQRSVWVVEVPRPPREDEKKLLPKEELAAWPEVPTYNLGDEITVTGKWALSSPRGFAASNGLLVYSALETLNAAAAPSE